MLRKNRNRIKHLEDSIKNIQDHRQTLYIKIEDLQRQISKLRYISSRLNQEISVQKFLSKLKKAKKE